MTKPFLLCPRVVFAPIGGCLAHRINLSGAQFRRNVGEAAKGIGNSDHLSIMPRLTPISASLFLLALAVGQSLADAPTAAEVWRLDDQIPLVAEQTTCRAGDESSTTVADAATGEPGSSAVGTSPGKATGIAPSYTQCFVEARDVMRRQSAQWQLLVDIRPTEQFDAYHIPRSINLSAHELRTKGFLKSKRVVVVDHGYRRKSLLALCQSLRENGFTNVQFLEGGIDDWRHQGGALSGTALPSSVVRVPPRAVLEEYDADHWRVVAVAEDPADARLRLVQVDQMLTPSADEALWDEVLQRAARPTSGRKGPAIVLVMADANALTPALQHAVGRRSDSFLLSGGIDEFARQWGWQMAVWSKKEFALQQVRGCGRR